MDAQNHEKKEYCVVPNNKSMLKEINVVSIGDYNKIVNMTFSTQEEAYEFFNRYAMRKGFRIRKSTVRKDKSDTTYRRFYCQQSGNRNKLLDKAGQKRKAQTGVDCDCDCPVELCVKLDPDSSLWRVVKFVDNHNHDLMPPDPIHFLWSNPFLGAAEKLEMLNLLASSLGITQIIKVKSLKICGAEPLGCSIKDLYSNHGKRFKMLQDDIELVVTAFRLKQQSDHEFYFKIKREDNGLLSHIFWADSQSRFDYTSFGDVVALDTSRRLDEYNMTFVPFFGCGNHGNTIFFGCGMVSCEEDGSYAWLLSAFREASYQVCPKSVITDDNPALCEAVKVHLPDTTHKICPVHMVRSAKKYIDASRVMDQFNALMSEICSPETFEKNWSEFEKNVNINPNSKQWLQLIYKWKHSWAGAFVKQEKFMGVSTGHINRTIHSNLHKLLNRKMSLINAVLHYEHFLSKSREDESYQNFKTNQTFPVCTTSFKEIEKFAARTYTQNLFYIVRDEITNAGNFVIIEKIDSVLSTKYILCPKGDADKSATVVGSNANNSLDLRCSCLKLEYEGVPCCHIFTVLIDMGVSFIPKSCICKKWTQDANKTGFRRKNELFRPWINHMEEMESLNEELKRQIRKDQVPEQFGKDLGDSSDEEQSLFSTDSPEPSLHWETPKNQTARRRKNKCGYCGDLGHNRQTCQVLQSGNNLDSCSRL